jgi:hypothetical protein
MSSGISLVVDLTIVTLLIVTIAFAAVLNRRLTMWRQDRAEFERLLKDALAIDPEKDPSSRLVTLVYQRRACFLLDRIDEKFSK